MKKLTLRLDDLAVESFNTTTQTEVPGTVHGAATYANDPCSGLLSGCNSLCETDCPTHCGENTCQNTCAVTCNCSGEDPACGGGNLSAANPASTCVGYCENIE